MQDTDATLKNLNWYGILGNHEYGYNVSATVDLHSVYPNWVMDGTYYSKRILLDAASNTYGTFLFIDTNPCISGYRGSDQTKW